MFQTNGFWLLQSFSKGSEVQWDYRNPSLGFVTKTKACKGASQEEAQK
jgi:hypothetical protein